MIKVTNLKTLKSLEKAGYIELHSHTGVVVGTLNGGKVKATYIQDYKTSCFNHNGVEYVCKFVSGSFYPYVFYK